MKIMHSPGMGVHYVNDNVQFFEDGSWQTGDSSDNCILWHVQVICEAFGLPPFWQLWTEVYPDDPLNESDGAFILSSAEPYTAFCNPYKDLALVLKDLAAIGRQELAVVICQCVKDRVH
jgi:hypothetical protein